jgi:hypothetical protein
MRDNGSVLGEEAELTQPPAPPADLLTESEPIQDSLTVAVKRHSRADFAQLTSSLVHPHPSPHPVKRDGCGQSTDAATDDRHS